MRRIIQVLCCAMLFTNATTSLAGTSIRMEAFKVRFTADILCTLSVPNTSCDFTTEGGGTKGVSVLNPPAILMALPCSQHPCYLPIYAIAVPKAFSADTQSIRQGMGLGPKFKVVSSGTEKTSSGTPYFKVIFHDTTNGDSLQQCFALFDHQAMGKYLLVMTGISTYIHSPLGKQREAFSLFLASIQLDPPPPAPKPKKTKNTQSPPPPDDQVFFPGTETK
jgi:hypothetical protein